MALPAGINTNNNYFRTFVYEGYAAAFLWFSLEGKSAFLADIMVFPEHQGKGMGTAFIRGFLNELTCQDASEVELRVAPGNQRALKKYTYLGFGITEFNMILLLAVE